MPQTDREKPIDRMDFPSVLYSRLINALREDSQIPKTEDFRIGDLIGWEAPVDPRSGREFIGVDFYTGLARNGLEWQRGNPRQGILPEEGGIRQMPEKPPGN